MLRKRRVVAIKYQKLLEPQLQSYRAQNQEYSHALFMDAVLKNEEFKKLWEQYLALDPVNSLLDDTTRLQTQMKTYYQKYVAACAKRQVDPLVPYGAYSFLASTTPSIVAEVPYGPPELVKFWNNNDQNSLMPKVSPENILDVINGILIPKYYSLSQTNLKASALNVPESDRIEILSFVTSRPVDIIGDPKFLLFFLKMLTPVELKAGLQHIDPWIQDECRHLFPHSGLLTSVAGIKKGEFGVEFKSISQLLNNWVGRFSVPTIEGEYAQAAKGVMQDLNKLFVCYGRQEFSLPDDAVALNKHITNWFTVLHQLVNFELKEWDGKTVKLEKLMGDHEFVLQSLKSPDLLYSGLALGDHSLSLVRTGKQEKAEDKSDLKKFADEHYKKYEADVTAYTHVKEHLPTLKAIRNWLEEVYAYIAKAGRFT